MNRKSVNKWHISVTLISVHMSLTLYLRAPFGNVKTAKDAGALELFLSFAVTNKILENLLNATWKF